MFLEIAPVLAIQWGSVADWVAAVGTVGSLFAALHIIKEERKEKRKAVEDAPLLQAQLVSAWSEVENDQHVLFAMNGGINPIYDVMVYGSPVDFIAHPSGPSHNVEVLFGTIAPGKTLDEKGQSDRLKCDRFGEPSVEIEFTDVHERHWKRGADRKVIEIKSRRPFD